MDWGLLGWFALLLASVVAADQGAEALADPFQKLRRHFGLSGAAGGAVLAIVTAGPEVGINTAAAARGSNEVGLGNMLGANIVSIPLILGIAYGATRWFHRKEPEARPRRLRLDRGVLTVQALPYLGILALLALLTVPPAWAGLQPIDGAIMGGAFVAFYVQAILRYRLERHRQSWAKEELGKALLGALGLGGGAYFAVVATEHLALGLGISPVVGGLFISSTMAVAPEAIKTWILVRIGETTAGTSSVIADDAVTMTLGFVPLAVVSTPLLQPGLYSLNVVAASVFGVGFCVAAYVATRENGIHGWLIWGLGALYGVWVLSVWLVVR